MRTSNVKLGFVSKHFSTLTSDKPLSAHIPHSHMSAQLFDTTPLFASWVEGVVGRCGSDIEAPRRKNWRSVRRGCCLTFVFMSQRCSCVFLLCSLKRRRCWRWRASWSCQVTKRPHRIQRARLGRESSLHGRRDDSAQNSQAKAGADKKVKTHRCPFRSLVSRTVF